MLAYDGIALPVRKWYKVAKRIIEIGLIGHFVLVLMPMKLDTIWFHRYFIFFLKR